MWGPLTSGVTVLTTGTREHSHPYHTRRVLAQHKGPTFQARYQKKIEASSPPQLKHAGINFTPAQEAATVPERGRVSGQHPGAAAWAVWAAGTLSLERGAKLSGGCCMLDHDGVHPSSDSAARRWCGAAGPHWSKVPGTGGLQTDGSAPRQSRCSGTGGPGDPAPVGVPSQSSVLPGS